MSNYRKYLNLKKTIQLIKVESVSIRKRFALYIVTAISMLLALVLVLLNLFGVLNFGRNRLLETLDERAASCEVKIEHDFDDLAAYAVSFSEQLETTLQHYLTDHGMTFEALKNNPEALNQLQGRMYDIVSLNMQLSPSSGAFYLLDTTVNSNSEDSFYNGIYLKYINIHSENTVNNDFTLYRGSYTTGKINNIPFHSGWQNELKTDFFETCEDEFSSGAHYVVSPVTEVPETWEHARYLYVPIHDAQNRIVGTCGFEINDLYFQLVHKHTAEQSSDIVYALLEEHDGHYIGQFSSNNYNFTNESERILNISEKNGFTIFTFGGEKCFGRTKEIQLENNRFLIAAMITEPQYEAAVRSYEQKFALFFFIIALFTFFCCVFMSKKYVAPFLQKIELLKNSEDYGSQIRIREIDDLFSYLEEKDSWYEAQLKYLEDQRASAEEEIKRAKDSYQKALAKYELAKQEVERLAQTHTEEIVPEDFEYFITNLKTLTPAEKRIYELYLSGKTAKEIVGILGITENTLKYHNKNIYSKLGISSRKQLLRFAALKQHEDEKNT